MNGSLTESEFTVAVAHARYHGKDQRYEDAGKGMVATGFGDSLPDFDPDDIHETGIEAMRREGDFRVPLRKTTSARD